MLWTPLKCSKSEDLFFVAAWQIYCTLIHALFSLSGRKHLVYTGVALVYRSQDGTLHNRCFHEETEVTFATLSDDIIQSYVASNEPL